MASTVNAFLQDLGADGLSLIVKSGVTVNEGDLLALYGPSAAATNGSVDKWSAGAGQILMGTAQKKVVGDGTKVVPIGVGPVILSLAVTGAASVADNGKPVYATDENTYTLTAPATKCKAVGSVISWRTGTTCFVHLKSYRDNVGEDLAGGQLEDLLIATLDAASLATGVDQIVDKKLLCHGEIIDFYSVVGKVLGGGGGVATIGLSIKALGGAYVAVGTPTTIVATTADALGLVTRSAAITTANVFHHGDLIKVTAATVTALTGQISIFATVRRRAGV